MTTFADYLGAVDDDYLGDDEFLGAPARRRFAPPGMRRSPTRSAAAAALAKANTGVTKAGPRLEPLGFTVVTFTAASGTTLQATAQPQKPFKGSRLVINEVRAATATGLVSLSDLRIGVKPVLVSAQPIPIAAFSPLAFGVELMLDDAGPGIIITATFVISAAPVMAETVTVGATIVGMTWS